MCPQLSSIARYEPGSSQIAILEATLALACPLVEVTERRLRTRASGEHEQGNDSLHI